MKKATPDHSFGLFGEAPYEEEFKKSKRWDKLGSVSWGVMIGSIVLMGIHILPLFIGIPLAVLGLAFCFFILPKKQKELQPYLDERAKWLEHNRLLPVLQQFFVVRGFQPDQFIDRPELQDYFNSGRNKLDGTYRNIDFESSDLRQVYKDRKIDMSDDNNQEVVRFSGTCLLCPVKKVFSDEQLKSIRKDLADALSEKQRQIHIIRCEDDSASILALIPRRLFGAMDNEQSLGEDAEYLKKALDTIADAAMEY